MNATITNTISVGSAGPAVVFKDVPTTQVLDCAVLQTAGPAGTPTVVWGEASAAPQYFEEQEINQGTFASATAQAGVVIAGVTPEELFEDPANGDLELLADSVALDLAKKDDAPSYDYQRRLRGIGSEQYDAGAYERTDIPNATGLAWTQYQ